MTYDTDRFDPPPPAHEERREHEPGIYDDLPEDDYHDCDALSSSAIRHGLSESVDAYHAWLDEDDPDSDAIQLGSLVHEAVLEPDLWQARLDQPDPPVDPGEMSSTSMALVEYMASTDEPTTEGGIEACGLAESTVESRMEDDDHRALADYYAEYGEPIDGDLVSEVRAISHSVERHPKVLGGLIDTDAGISEVSAFWQQPQAVRCKARVDHLVPFGSSEAIVDLKTTSRSLGYWKRRLCWQRRYHQQLAWYRRGLEELGREIAACFVVVVETDPPHDVCVYQIGDQTLDYADLLNVDAVGDLADYWLNPSGYTGRQREIETLEAPEWAR